MKVEIDVDRPPVITVRIAVSFDGPGLAAPQTEIIELGTNTVKILDVGVADVKIQLCSIKMDYH